jgi:hypothetical protein
MKPTKPTATHFQISPLHRGRESRGFALIVTLSLMVLLAILALGMLTLSTVTLRSAGHGDAQSRAQANARMALMLALGELQKDAGRDRIVTATADIAGAADGGTLAAEDAPENDLSINKVSKRLSAVQPGTRYWTGVFVNLDEPGSVFTKTPSPANIHWLVSGCKTTYSPANPAGGPDVFPSNAAYAVAEDGSVTDPKKAVILAGKNTVGGIQGYVVAPLQEIYAKNSTYPTGRIGWWVGDEGVKARINIGKTGDSQTEYASLLAQRRGWETVAGFQDYPLPDSPSHASLPKVTGLAQVPLLLPGVAGAATQGIFHSATADSRAVLADTLNGGTKIDLSAVLSGDLPVSSPDPSIANYPLKGRNIIPSEVSSTMIAPKWDAVKDFHDRAGQMESGHLIVRAAATEDTAAIAPLVIDFRFLLGVKIKLGNSATNEFRFNPCGKIAIAIANPYSAPLRWKQDIEIEIPTQTPLGGSNTSIWQIQGAPFTATIPFVKGTGVPGISPPDFDPATPTKPAVFNNVFFRIRPSSLEPGEARAYTLDGYYYRTRPSGNQRLVVYLAPFQSSAPYDFNKCIELENPYFADASLERPRTLGVREGSQSSLIGLEMKLAGSSGILRRLNRFELDNAHVGATWRWFYGQDEPEPITQPIPLMCYSYQLSQPGEDYLSLMPNGWPAIYNWGQRGSTLRTFTDFNLQATRVRRPIASYSPPPYFFQGSNSLAQLPSTAPGGDTGTMFTRNLAVSPQKWGYSGLQGSEKTILFSVPSEISSIAQLQHADLTGDDSAASIAHQPGNAVANSYAPPFVKRGLTSQGRTDYLMAGSFAPGTAYRTPTTYYDISYLLNATLLDSYFFSGIPATGAAVPANPELITLDRDASAAAKLRDPVKAASLLMLDGAFNVNSTDKNAWKAFLSSARHFKHKAGPSGGTDAAFAAFPRSLEQISPSAVPPTGRDADSFSGYRRLNDAQLDSLAEGIVKQVRLRGPFVSVSHFANRALAALTSEPALTRSGALQSAIDESGANIDYTGGKNAFSGIDASIDAVAMEWKTRNGLSGPRADMDGVKQGPGIAIPASVDPNHPDFAATSADANYGTIASIVADQEMLVNYPDAWEYRREQGYRSTGIPGWLTQADVLQVIGNSLTARSDTFRIRSYGESLDRSGNVIAKAYCEAIVQRNPGYVDPSNDPSARGASLSATNQRFGRKFEIVSFRWLSPEEI